ncbi:MAG: AI-2E family transporter [Pseudomonadota bacterium]
MAYRTAGIWIIAAGMIMYGLHVGRDILAPFALAVFLWLVMEGLARVMNNRIPAIPRTAARLLSVAVVVGGAAAVVGIFVDGLAEFVQNAGAYERRINELIAEAYGWFDINQTMVDPPTLSALIFNEENTRFIQPVVDAVQGLASSSVLILIYIAFLFLAESNWSQKLDAVFPHPTDRAQARSVAAQIRNSMEQYLWVQTVISGVITLLTYATLAIMGLDNALFWAFVVFFLNYIPTIGSIVAAFLPGVFALAQTEWPAYMPADPTLNAVLVLGAVSVWQFVIGNFLQPRMMGETLNISALVVLLALAVWGAIWGLPGMFLSAPLTVLLMILLAQTDGARWIAILLSADGRPDPRATAPDPALTEFANGEN